MVRGPKLVELLLGLLYMHTQLLGMHLRQFSRGIRDDCAFEAIRATWEVGGETVEVVGAVGLP